MDLTKLSRQDLTKMKSDIERELKKRERREKADAKKKIQAIAAQAGFSVKELFESDKAKPARKPATRKRAKAKVKFRDPKDAKNTWTGRGRMPKWMVAQIDKGKKKEDFAI